MIDFTNCQQKKKAYSGANGNKLSIIYNNELYMLKFPSEAKKNPELSYSNSCISEYIGCKIFDSVGIPTQEVLLGTFNSVKGQKVVVACKDFTVNGDTLQDFASLKNQMIDSVRNGYGTDLSEIEQTIYEQNSIDTKELSERFWDMFIVDALIGNWDRHNGNWGFLYNLEKDTLRLAPVFDCGSSLYPQADNDMIRIVLNNAGERNARIYNYPMSAITINDKKINYYNFISSCQNDNCNAALMRTVPKIDMDKIYEIVQDTPFIDNLQKDFYTTMIKERKERILDYSFNKLTKTKEFSQEKADVLGTTDFLGLSKDNEAPDLTGANKVSKL